ncbi:hypothetical protein [Glaciecola punicea]|uniref:hypothetical protein n=1 Tax=Glaciecola punicea TaxID=56804 RepID=UPI00058C2ACE|nr:hypothetical protein [Glaciecola punicea]
MYLSGAIVAFLIGSIGGFIQALSKRRSVHPAARDNLLEIFIQTTFSAVIYGILSWVGVIWAISVLIQSNDT